MRRMTTGNGSQPLPTDLMTTDTVQTITADKKLTANLYRKEGGYDLTPQNTGLVNGYLSKSTCTLGSKIKLYVNSSEAEQQANGLVLQEQDYFILRYNNSMTKYEFSVYSTTAHWWLMDTTDNTVIDSGTISGEKTITCEPHSNGDYKLWFDHETSVYSWSSDSDEEYRYITVQERGTKIYHHHLLVKDFGDEKLYMDVLSTHPESFINEEWPHLAEAKCVGTATLYKLDNNGVFQECYTLCGYSAQEPTILRVFNHEGTVLSYSVSEYILSDTVTI